jgi:glutathione S-transferase
MALTLYSDRFWISPWVFSCYVTIEEKGVPFDLVEVALDKKETQRPDYKRDSITAKVPAIDHDGFWISESAAIVEYLEEAFPSPRALPADAKARTRARQLMSFLRTDFFTLRKERSTNFMFYGNPPALTPEGEADMYRLYDAATAFLAGGATSLFGEWSVADSELAFYLQRLGMTGHELPAALRPFVAAQWSRPSVQSYVNHARAAYVPY